MLALQRSHRADRRGHARGVHPDRSGRLHAAGRPHLGAGWGERLGEDPLHDRLLVGADDPPCGRQRERGVTRHRVLEEVHRLVAAGGLPRPEEPGRVQIEVAGECDGGAVKRRVIQCALRQPKAHLSGKRSAA